MKNNISNGDGVYEYLKESIFPRYHLVFGTYSFSSLGSKNFAIESLPGQESYVGIRIKSNQGECKKVFFKKLKNIGLSMSIYDSENKLIVSEEGELSNWTWSYSSFNESYDEYSSCLIYSRNMYFTPEINKNYKFKVNIKDTEGIELDYQPFISSVAAYSL